MRTISFAAALFLASPAPADEPRFDPLQPEELQRIISLLVESGRTNSETRITRVTLLPGPKDAAPERQARVVAMLDGVATEIDIDLAAGEIEFTEISTGQPPITSAEWARANAVLREDETWRAALAARGIDNPDAVFCESLSAGYFLGQPWSESRVIRMPCYEITDATTHIYGRPIEGLIATVDVLAEDIVEVLDEGITPIPAPAPQLPSAIANPGAPNGRILVDGHRVEFGLWSLHAAMDDQFGLLLSDVTVRDGEARRSILHQGHVSEVYVPYMDATESWAFRNYLDAGEFGLGVLVSPLIPGVDCPSDAVFLESHRLSPSGRIITQENAICVFAEPLRGPVWRHYEALNDASAGIAGEALVVRSISAIAHYDYIFDWVFGPSGEIEVRIGATGIDAVQARPGHENTAVGNRVTPDLVAVFHDHFFALRLDLDIDGPRNTLVRENVVVGPGVDTVLGRSTWSLEPEVISEEGPLVAEEPGVWRVTSGEGTGVFGGSTSYQVVPEGTVSIIDTADWPQQRAMFSAAPLWLTEWAPDERSAAGDYPNQHPGGDGLPAYSDGDPVVDTDLVLWPTIGFRHITRVEDWPILSVVWKSIHLRPYGFFDGNPSVD